MWNSMRKSLRDLDRERLLDMVGLAQRRTTAERLLPVFAFFGTGLLIGVGVGLMVARRPGSELRHDLRARMGKAAPPKATVEEPVERSWPNSPPPNAPHPSAPHS